MNSRQKIFGVPPALAIVIVFVLLYAWKYAGAMRWILEAKGAVRKDPTLANIPLPLADNSVSIAPGTKISEFGFQFEVPWIATVRISEDYVAIITVPEKDVAASFFNPAKDPGALKQLHQTLKEHGQDPRSADLYFDATSDYDLERSMWYATPDHLSLFFPRRKDVFGATRLTIKEARIHEARNGLYAFTIGKLRGFQLGDPARAHSVHVVAFDDQDRKFEFVFGSKPGPVFTITQADINRILQTLRPAPVSLR